MIARIALVLLSVAAPAFAQFKLAPATREILQLQIALEREGFSPGIVDGKTGPKLALAVAERFHCTRALLDRLNPSANMTILKEGDTLTVPAIEKPKPLRASRLQIHLGQKVIRAFDRGGKTIALFHCSIAKDESKRPSGTTTILSITTNPAYRFDPAMWPEVTNVNQKLLIPPGPRNPVGLCWIALSLPGYGIHGSPTPEMIGKTGSHGCFRLTNWDAQRLGGMVEPAMPVEFIK